MINDPGVATPLPGGATVAAYIQKKWGRAVRALPPRNVTVQTTPVQICTNHPRRFLLAISNPSINDVWELGSDAVSLTSGFKLQGAGGTIVYTVDEDGELVTYDHWVISSSFGFTILVQEIESI